MIPRSHAAAGHRLAVAVALLLAAAPAASAREEEPVVLRIAGNPATLDSDRLVSAVGPVHAVVALTRIPTPEDRAALAAIGVRLHQYLPDHAWFATVPAGGGPALLSLGFVRAAEPFRADWKGSAAVVGDPASSVRGTPDGRLHAHVYFFPDTTPAEARDALARVGVEPLDAEFEVNERIAALVAPARFPDLLAEDHVRWVEDGDPERATCNHQSAVAAGVDRAQASPLGLSGKDVRVGVMDEANVQSTHADFGSRVTRAETVGSSWSSHGTHVTGTILGSGSGSTSAKGMAPGALAWTWSFTGDTTSKKSAGFSSLGLRADSNSWGSVVGWRYSSSYGWLYYPNTSRFGAYEGRTADLDLIMESSGTLVNFAAGNDGSDGGTTGGHYDVNLSTGSATWHTGAHAPDGGTDGFGSSSPDSAFKNGLCVASMTQSTWQRSSFSGNGPARDGRLKPDITAVGEQTWSTVPTDSYGSMSGTSMATPVVTGVAALVIEAWRDAHGGADPRLDVLKGLLLHTAKDIARPGPDYDTGFGAIDAHAAATLAASDGASSTWHATGSTAHGATSEHSVAVADAQKPFVVTLCWTDRAGNPAASRALVNDLDLVLRAPSGALHLPWRLDPSSPASHATRGVNSLDNTEKAEVVSPETGTWTVLVKGSTIPSGPQPYAVWFSQPAGAIAVGPVANPGTDVTVSATTPSGAVITLDGRASSAAGGSIATWQWDTDGDGSFTDPGGSASGPVVQVAFPVGSRVVTLRVTDAGGSSDAATLRVTVVNDAPVADLGPDRTLHAPDASGVVLDLDTSGCSDPQTPADIVAWDWDLDGDGQYDDYSGPSPRVRFYPGTRNVGLRIRDTLGLEDEDSFLLDVVTAEYVLPNGGRGYGSLSSAADVDTFLVHVLDGGTVGVTLTASFPYRLRIRGASGEEIVDISRSFSVSGTVTATTTGWYWVEVSATTLSWMQRRYHIDLDVRAPSVGGTAWTSLGATGSAESHHVVLAEGAHLTARLRAAGRGSNRGTALLRLIDPEGNVLAEASAGERLMLRRAPASGVYELRVIRTGGADGDFRLSWKGRRSRARGERFDAREEPASAAE